MTRKAEYLNQDLIDFKRLILGDARKSNMRCMKIFGMSEGTFYNLRTKPAAKLQPWYASQLAVYKALTVDALANVLLTAHGVDIRDHW